MTRLEYEARSVVIGLFYVGGATQELFGLQRENVGLMVIGLIMLAVGKHLTDGLAKALIKRDKL